jgi:branched-chain amino acid transport system permease protein
MAGNDPAAIVPEAQSDQGARSTHSAAHRTVEGLRWWWPVLSLCALLAALVGFSSLGGSATQRTATEMLVYVVLVVGLYIFAGNSGILSFGHISFMAIGAYAGALLTVPPIRKAVLLPDLPGFLEKADVPTVPALLAASACAALFGAVIGIALMRLSGIAAALSMFAVLLVVHVVANNWETVTRGRLTMLGVPTNTTRISALVVAIVVIICAYVFQESATGLRLRAARENDAAARAIGVNVVRERWIAFVVSAFVVGAGGFIYGEFLGTFNPDAFYLNITFLTIAMLVVGGLRSLAGAVVGVVIVTAVGEFLRRLEEGAQIGPLNIPERPGLREGGLALLMLLILIFRPRGITGGREVPWPGALLAKLRVGRVAHQESDPPTARSEGE